MVLDGRVVEFGNRQIGVVEFHELWPGALDTPEVTELADYFKDEQRMAVTYVRLDLDGKYVPKSCQIRKTLLTEVEFKLFSEAISRKKPTH